MKLKSIDLEKKLLTYLNFPYFSRFQTGFIGTSEKSEENEKLSYILIIFKNNFELRIF